MCIRDRGYITKSTSASGFYLAAIKNADLTGKAEIPRYISEADPLAPSTEVNVGNEAVPDLEMCIRDRLKGVNNENFNQYDSL